MSLKPSEPLKIGQEIQVRVEKLVTGGAGLARHEGKVIFIPYSAPGDLLLVKITEVFNNRFSANILNILERSSSRQEPPCPVFGKCGGCSWMHIEYQEQLAQKEQILSSYLERHLSIPIEVRLPIQASAAPLRYRHKLKLKIQNSYLGYYATGSHDFVKVNDCWLAEQELSKAWPHILSKVQGIDHGELDVWLNIQGDVSFQVRNAELEENEQVLGFAQVNREQNKNLIETLLSWVKTETYDFIYDFYAGNGNFSFPLQKTFPKSRITAVEAHLTSVKNGQAEALKNSLSTHQLLFYASPVENYLKRAALEPQSLVVLDPPRGGCDEHVMKSLAYSQFKKLIYISCNHTTFCRDLDRLQKHAQKNFTIKRLQAFDMFPQTDHIELIAEILFAS